MKRKHIVSRMSAARFFKPSVELLEERNLFAVSVTVGANISKLNDNQAEGTIAIDPTAPFNVFSASMTLPGPLTEHSTQISTSRTSSRIIHRAS
jgi:hypothetical protein